MKYIFPYQKFASSAIAFNNIMNFLGDGNPAAPGTGPAHLVVQVYDPNAVAPFEVPVDGLLSNLAADNCFNPANIAAGATPGAWIVWQAVDAVHPAQYATAFLNAGTIRCIPGGDMNKVGALGGFDVTVENSDITNAASWRDGKGDTVDISLVTYPYSAPFATAGYHIIADETGFHFVFADPTQMIQAWFPCIKMTDTFSNDPYPLVWNTDPSTVWASNDNGKFNGNYWHRFSQVNNTTVVALAVQNVTTYSNGYNPAAFNFKSDATLEWSVLPFNLHCFVAGHHGAKGTIPYVFVTGISALQGWGVENMQKEGVDYGYIVAKNSNTDSWMPIVFESDSVTDVTAL